MPNSNLIYGKYLTYKDIELYNKSLEGYKRDYFFKPDGIHGLLHMKRVLLHVITLSKCLSINERDRNILIIAAKYHDIGRDNDKVDPTHGEKSFAKILSIPELESEVNELLVDDLEVLQAIIEYHCIDDKQAEKEILNSESYQKPRILYLLDAFKDADGLDWVRFNQLDISYLRYKISKQLVDFAEHLLENVK